VNFVYGLQVTTEYMLIYYTVINVWNSLPDSIDFRSLASFIRTVTVVDLSDHLRCFSNMFYSVLRQMLEHFCAFLSCSFALYFIFN